MGQYYVPTLYRDNQQMKTFYPHDYNNGLKLMEHSYIGNNLVAAVLHELVDNPHRVWWLGDYVDDFDFADSEEIKKLTERERKDAWSDKYNVLPNDDNEDWVYDDAYLINLDKECYIKLEKNLPHQWQVCPLPILTAVGNGKGSGDYYNEDQSVMDKVGTWAGDKMFVSFSLDEDEKNKYEDVTECYIFQWQI